METFMETWIVGIAVGGAALWVLARLGRGLRAAARPDIGSPGCGGGCGGCPGAGRAACRPERRPAGPLGPALAVLAVLAPPAPARAADTVETWGLGASDVELYFGTDGVRGDEPAVHGELTLGYGLVERLSAYLGVTMAGDETLGTGSHELYFGLFGTPIDTDHFDADLFLNLQQADGLQVEPAVEFNLDVEPDLAAWGVYLRVGVPVHGREGLQAGGVAEPHRDRTFHVEINPGLYWAVTEGHQLFAEYDMALHPESRRPEDPPAAEVGGVALGYNVGLGESIELVNQIGWDLPQGGERASFGVMTGLIATLPSSGAGPAL